jgi:hypothetical protein
LWLEFLELTYLNWCAWTFNISLHWFPGIVMWAIGWSMVAVVVNWLRFGRADWLYGPQPGPGRAPIPVPPNAGFDLAVVYLMWIGIVLALYPLCRWFARLKQTRRSAWLSYL